jgi:hypothetical protein
MVAQDGVGRRRIVKTPGLDQKVEPGTAQLVPGRGSQYGRRQPLVRGCSALPDHRDAGARSGGRDANVIGEAGDDRQAHVLRESQRNRSAGRGCEIDAEGRAVTALGTGPCRQADARRQVVLRSLHRVGHHYLELLAVIGERYPDGQTGAVPLVRLNRPGACLANREAYLVEQ